MAALDIRHYRTPDLPASLAAKLQDLCDAAYDSDTRPYFAMLGPGDHLLGTAQGVVATHLMWVTRWLQPAGREPLRTAYVEMVATAPGMQRRGYASALLREVATRVRDYDVAALCPATDGIYRRLGWTFWRGPLAARRDGRLLPTPDERVMILETPRTPRLDLDAPLSIEWRDGEVW